MASLRKMKKTSSVYSNNGEGRKCLNPYYLDEQEIENLEDAKKIIRLLKEKCKDQAHQLLIFRRKLKEENEMAAAFRQKKTDHLKSLSFELLVFEAQLIKKQQDISNLLSQKDILIARLRQKLHFLQNRLFKVGIESPLSDSSGFTKDFSSSNSDSDSFDDSDVGIVLEERNKNERNFSTFCSKLDCESFSDEIEPDGDYISPRRSNSFIKKLLQVLETKHVVAEEEGDAKGNSSLTKMESPKKGMSQTTYNQISNNHRTVTKPKDVKNKRITKTKSLEELRSVARK